MTFSSTSLLDTLGQYSEDSTRFLRDKYDANHKVLGLSLWFFTKLCLCCNFKLPMKLNHLTVLILACLASGCQQESITSTWVPKEEAASMPAMAQSQTDRGIDWKLPS